MDFLPQNPQQLSPEERALIEKYIAGRNTIENELGKEGEPVGNEWLNYTLNRGVRGLADIDTYLTVLDSRGDRGEDAFATDDFYKTENDVRNLISSYVERNAALPKNERQLLQDYAILNNKYVQANKDLDEWERDFYRISRKDINDGGKYALQEIAYDLREQPDAADDSWRDSKYNYELALRKDPAYLALKEKILNLAKKYNI